MNSAETARELENLARDFYAVCKTIISIYDADRNCIASYPKKMCDFCEKIREKEDLTARCIAHDEAAFDICDKTLSTHKYICHMGLNEIASPIVKDGIILGYLLFGQITDEKDRARIGERIEKLDYPELFKSELRAAAPQVKYRSQDYISSITKILEMSAAYIMMKDIISIKSGSLAFSIASYIKQNLSEALDTASLCAHFGISRSSLYLLSKQFFKMSITEYIRKERIAAAKKLIAKGSMNISAVALSVGIADANYFTKVFKAHVGMTPKAYEKSTK